MPGGLLDAEENLAAGIVSSWWSAGPLQASNERWMNG